MKAFDRTYFYIITFQLLFSLISVNWIWLSSTSNEIVYSSTIILRAIQSVDSHSSICFYYMNFLILIISCSVWKRIVHILRIDLRILHSSKNLFKEKKIYGFLMQETEGLGKVWFVTAIRIWIERIWIKLGCDMLKLREKPAFYHILTRRKNRISDKLAKRMKHSAPNQYLSPFQCSFLASTRAKKKKKQCISPSTSMQNSNHSYISFDIVYLTWRKRLEKCLLLTSINSSCKNQQRIVLI